MHFNKSFEIDGRKIGEGCRPYIIAEMSANHGGNLQNAINIIKEAKKIGADAIKLQHYKPDTITMKHESEDFFINEGPWKGQYLFDLYEYAHTPWEWTEKLVETAKEVGITIFSSPFDYSAVDFLEKFDMPAYKIASSELIDLPLIRKIARTKKPIIMSTGFSTLAGISKACEVLIQENVKDVCILKCTAEYPAPLEEVNLETIRHLKEAFSCVVGFSDHTLGSAVPIASVAFGASVIEKHFILNRNDDSADSFFSATPSELKEVVDGANQVYKAIGKVTYPIKPPSPKRSLIATIDIKKGEKFEELKNFKSLRPGGGITPDNLELVNSKVASNDIKKGTLLTWDMIGG